MRRSARWIALLGIASVAVGMIVAPAAGRDRRDPVAVIACQEISPGVCQESGQDSLPPNSYGSQSTDTVPADAKTADVTLTPDAPPDKVPFDNLWVAIVDSQPKLAGVTNKIVQRFVTCQLLAFALTGQALEDMDVTVHAKTFRDAYAATFYVCLTLAFAEPPASTASAAPSRPCQALVGVPIQVSRSGSTYTVGAQGRSFKPRRPPLAVSCRRKGSGLVISLRPRRRAGRLRALLGPHLTIGFANHGGSSVHFRTTYRFSK